MLCAPTGQKKIKKLSILLSYKCATLIFITDGNEFFFFFHTLQTEEG
jgi:hypothetical protein